MNEKAIEAAAKALWICNECSGDCFDDNGNECPHCFGSGMDIRAAIVAYEKSLWVPIEECPEEWKDGRSIISISLDSKIPAETRWLPIGPFHQGPNGGYYGNAGWYWSGWDGCVGPVRLTHVRPLPAAPEGE